jgi:hypothetical protein
VAWRPAPQRIDSRKRRAEPTHRRCDIAGHRERRLINHANQHPQVLGERARYGNLKTTALKSRLWHERLSSNPPTIGTT